MEFGRVQFNVKIQREVLQAFSNAMQRDVHNLIPNPRLRWQQFQNYLK